jgi:hypothetical protein
MNRIRILAVMIFIPVFGILSASQTAGSAGSFLRYGLDARSESLGRAVTADTSSAYAVFFNPATASAVTEMQILTGMKILSMDRNFAYLSYIHPVKGNAAISAGILYSGTGDIEARDKYGNQFDTYSYNENLFYLNFGLKPKKFLSIGVTAKILWSRFPEFDALNETVSSFTFAYDAGCNIFIPGLEGLVLGAAARNIKGKNSWDSSMVWTDGTASTDYYPATYTFGAAWNPAFNPDLGIFASINSDDFKEVSYGAGVEWINRFEKENSSIAIRTGTVSGQLSFGLGFEFIAFGKKMIADYSFTHEGISEYDPHSLSWRFFF